MASAPPSDAVLVRYLLGEADPGDEDRFDELSVADAAFAERLRAVEHDLADAYARGELPPSDRERWEARYLASQHGRDDLAVARALAARERRGQVMRISRPGAWWSLAAAAVLLLAVIGGYRLVHREPPHVSVARQPPVMTPATAPAPPASVAHVVALTLTPPVRSIAAPPTLVIPPGTTDVKLTVQLDADAHQPYRIALRDLSSNAVVWTSSDTAAEGGDMNPSLAVSIPASSFRTGRYLISVSDGPADARETVATYLLVVVLQ